MPRISRKDIIKQNISGTVLIQNKNKIYSAGIYARLSKKDNNLKDSDSIEIQTEISKNYISSQEDIEIYSEYYDNGNTGTNFERKGVLKLLEDVKSGYINCVVVKDFSRLVRNHIEAGEVIENVFLKYNVRLIAVNDNYDSLNDPYMDSILLKIKNLINELYSRDKSEKTKLALKIKQEKGQLLTTFPPYGYLKDNNNGIKKLIIDEYASKIVRDIFKWKAEGLGDRKIAKKLDDLKILTPFCYYYKLGLLKKEPKKSAYFWNNVIIKKITTNIVYLGHLAQGKSKSCVFNTKKEQVNKENWIIVKNTHEVIIEENIFNYVQIRCINSVWTSGMVRHIIKDERYTRTWIGCKVAKQSIFDKPKLFEKEKWIIRKNNHIPIISAEVFNKSQEVIKKCSNVKNKRKIDVNILKRKVICSCGFAMKKENRKKGSFYICRLGDTVVNANCKEFKVYEKDILNYVLKEINNKINESKQLKFNYEKNYNRDLENEIKNLEQQIYNKKQQLIIDFENYSNDIISSEEFKIIKQELSINITALNEKIDYLNEKLNKKNSDNIDPLINDVKYLTEDVINKYIDKINVIDSDNYLIDWEENII